MLGYPIGASNFSGLFSLFRSTHYKNNRLPRHLPLSEFRLGMHIYRKCNSHRTFPFMPYLSSPSIGTGTPHVRSRVNGVGINPLRSLASTISPSVLMVALTDHFPFLYDCLIHSSVLGWITSSFRYIWAEVRVVITWALSIRHRGFISSTASKVRLHPSHWSPRASLRNGGSIF